MIQIIFAVSVMACLTMLTVRIGRLQREIDLLHLAVWKVEKAQLGGSDVAQDS